MNLGVVTTIQSTHPIVGWLYAIGATGTPKAKPSVNVRRSVHELAKSEIVEVMQPRSVAIECLDGSVWVTLDYDLRDVVLEAGQAFVVNPNHRALVQALDASRVRFIAPACESAKKALQS